MIRTYQKLCNTFISIKYIIRSKVLYEDTDGFELYREVLSDMIDSTISQIKDCYHIDPIDVLKQ